MSIRPEIHPYIRLLQWFPFKASPSADLLRAYVDAVNAQVGRSIEAFQIDSVEEEIEDPFDPSQSKIIRHHGGLDDESWDLHDVFEDYFPNLQRASAVITLFAFFERELEDLCNLIQSTENYRLNRPGIRGGCLV
mgnify:CR=1 FL=1